MCACVFSCVCLHMCVHLSVNGVSSLVEIIHTNVINDTISNYNELTIYKERITCKRNIFFLIILQHGCI